MCLYIIMVYCSLRYMVCKNKVFTANCFYIFSEKHLAGLETEFGRFNQFLGSFLNIVVKRGSHPHCKWLVLKRLYVHVNLR